MTKAFRFFVEEISDIRKSVSKEQWELQKICRKMGWPSGTTKIAEDKGHAIIEEEALPRFREYLQDSQGADSQAPRCCEPRISPAPREAHGGAFDRREATQTEPSNQK